MSKELSASSRKVQDALNARRLTCRVVELPSSTRTAQEAAQAVGCRVEQDEKLWAAAGTSNAVFQLKSADLKTMTDGKVISIK